MSENNFSLKTCSQMATVLPQYDCEPGPEVHM